MEIGNDLEDGTTEVSLDLKEALYCTKFGLETILRCHMAGISTTDLPEMIRLRGEYLAQEPDTRDRGKMVKPKKCAPAGGYGGNNNKDNRPTGQKGGETSERE